MSSTRVTIDLEKVEFASFAQRIGARILDTFIVSLLFLSFIYISGHEIVADSKHLDLGLGSLLWFIPLFAIAYEVPLMAGRGITIGKRIFGICVVRTDGLIGIGFDRALIRYIVPQLVGIIPIIGVFGLIAAQGWYIYDPKRQNLADKAAKTFVIRSPFKKNEAVSIEEKDDQA